MQPEDARQWVATATAVANVNIRNGPGMGYNKIGVLANGQTAEIIGKSPDGFWWAIKLPVEGGGEGWVSVDYVVTRNADSVPVIDLGAEAGLLIVPTPVTGAPKVVALAMVNIRSGPGVEYKVLARLEPGQEA